MTNQTVLIAMSGGVDSSVAAFLLRRAGLDCHGITMRLFDPASFAIMGETAPPAARLPRQRMPKRSQNRLEFPLT